MRLELTVTESIIKDRFNIDDKYDNCRNRLKKHVLVSSNELFSLWEEDAKKYGYIVEFQDWFFKISKSYANFRKFKIGDIDCIDGTEIESEKIVVATARASNDKVVVGDMSSNLKKNLDIRFINETIFLKDGSHTVTISDISNVLKNHKNEKLFNIYETPIRLEIRANSNSNILSEYLSKFIKDSKEIIIKDAYLNNQSNERNLKKYILPHLDLDSCQITIITTWDELGKKRIEQKFINYLGPNTKMICAKEDDKHSSYIKTDKYIIDLGYRLQIFGFEDNGLTEADIINITRQ